MFNFNLFKLRKTYLFFFIILNILHYNTLLSQDTSLIVADPMIKSAFGLYDYSDIKKVNFEVIVWGGVINPGKYIVPEGTTLIDIISYSGIKSSEKLFGDIKLLRPKKGFNSISSNEVKSFNLEKIFLKDQNSYSIDNLLLQPGDMLIFKFEPEKTFFDYVKDVLLFVTPIASLAALIITITRTN
ncbi:MAG TPA: hypothetical protein DEP28_04815 [Bacteroidetes bacterium]|nr:hypothetical protein [Bacteroidota bacterium]